MKRSLFAFGAVAAVLVTGNTVRAQSVEPFTNKNMQVLIGFGTGGGYDIWGRLVARHIGRNLPGKPTVIPQNMPGAGSFVATSHIYNAAPKDGTVFGIIARDAALGPLLGAPGARYDAIKLSWLGTPTKETNVCIAYNTKKVKTAEDLFTNELIIGDTGPGTGTRQFPRALAQILGLKFRNVSGFPSSADVFLAMERGEVDGFCESLDSIKSRRPDWIPQKKVTILFQGGVEKNQELKDVPIIIDLAKTEEQKRIIEFLYSGQGIGRPFVAPPNMPPERLKTLRNAFAATMKDPEFMADVKNSKFELDPEDGDHLQSLIEKIYATPKAIVDKVGELVK